jgi:hypothetical protein
VTAASVVILSDVDICLQSLLMTAWLGNVYSRCLHLDVCAQMYAIGHYLVDPPNLVVGYWSTAWLLISSN